MAVLVEFEVRDANEEQMYDLEARTRRRGEALGRPPYVGCLFLAVGRGDGVFRFVSAWRTEDAFRDVMATMLGPDLATVGAQASGLSVTEVLSMAIPGMSAP